MYIRVCMCVYVCLCMYMQYIQKEKRDVLEL